MNKRQRKKNIKRYYEREADLMMEFSREMWQFRVDYLLQPLRLQDDPSYAQSARLALSLCSQEDAYYRESLSVRQKRRLRK